MDTKQLETLTAKFCDEYCKFPCEIKEQEDLEKICNECPMNELFNLLPPAPKKCKKYKDVCGCGVPVFPHQNYCPDCGRELNWEA